MSLSPYERVCDALRHELQLSRDREFETLVAKAKLHVGAQGIRLSEKQQSALFQIYLDAKHSKPPADATREKA